MRRATIIYRLLFDVVTFVWLLLRPSETVAVENLFLRRQLALYKEHDVKPRRTDPTKRLTLSLLSSRFDWKEALTIVQPRTLIRWHRGPTCRIRRTVFQRLYNLNVTELVTSVA